MSTPGELKYAGQLQPGDSFLYHDQWCGVTLVVTSKNEYNSGSSTTITLDRGGQKIMLNALQLVNVKRESVPPAPVAPSELDLLRAEVKALAERVRVLEARNRLLR
jgi:hypothetical protein